MLTLIAILGHYSHSIYSIAELTHWAQALLFHHCWVNDPSIATSKTKTLLNEIISIKLWVLTN